jgi:hypothetical protein
VCISNMCEDCIGVKITLMRIDLKIVQEKIVLVRMNAALLTEKSKLIQTISTLGLVAADTLDIIKLALTTV